MELAVLVVVLQISMTDKRLIDGVVLVAVVTSTSTTTTSSNSMIEPGKNSTSRGYKYHRMGETEPNPSSSTVPPPLTPEITISHYFHNPVLL
mmetsp:Transcript_25836/g.60830  ORF Transcript_25836/g.60830 Transcript_25836/m.60830 type:complete len:92 (-) Transcript_25836:1753-2028(-)